MPFQLPDGRTLALDTPFTWDEVQYPANWLRLSTPEEKNALGIQEVPEPPVFDQRFWWGYTEGGELIPKQLEDETTTDEAGNTVSTTGLKTLWRQQTAQTCGSLLAPTDWYVVREADTGLAAPVEIRSWRQQLRDAAAAKQAAIAAVSSVDELAAYISGPGASTVDPATGQLVVDPATAYSYWPAQPAVVQPGDGCDYRAFYDALLISPAYAAIRAKAVDSPAVLTACVEFIAAIGDAKAGRPNQPAIQACVDLLCAAAQFTAQELAALAEVMATGGLDQVYTLPA